MANRLKWAQEAEFNDLTGEERIEQRRLKQLSVQHGGIIVADAGWQALEESPDQERLAKAGRLLRELFPLGEAHSASLQREAALMVRNTIDSQFPGAFVVYFQDEEEPV